MRIGILGTGFGKRHAEIFKALPGVEVVGIVGRNPQKTADAARELDIPGYTDPAEFLARSDIDAIDVCFRTEVHAQYAMMALQQGKHVFCETPVAYTLEDAAQMQQAAQTSGRLLMVGLYDRFVSDYKYVHDLIKAGRIGAMKVAVATRRTPPIWGNVAANITLSLMIHDIDYLCWLLGVPQAITTCGLKNPSAGWDQVFINFEYEQCMAQVEGNCIMPMSFPFTTGLRVVGTEGAIEIHWYWGGTHPISSVTWYPPQGEPEKLTIPGYDPYEAECRYFADCVHGNTDPALLSITTAYDSLRMALAANQSLAQQGQRIELAQLSRFPGRGEVFLS